MYRKIIFIWMLIISQVPLFAQYDMAWDAKFAIGGGFTPGWIIPELDEINNMMESFGTGKFSTSGMFATGGAGYISIAVVKNVRIGMMGLGGSMTKSNNGLEAEYSQSVLGFTAEYTFPFIPKVAVSAGAIIGGGNATLNLHRFNSNYTADWNHVWQEISDIQQPVSNVSRKLSNSYFTIIPTLNVDIPLYSFFAFRIGGGYQIALGDNWELDNGFKVSNIPSGLSSNAIFIQAGVFIGYFKF